MLHSLLLILDHDLVVFVEVNLAFLTGLPGLAFRPPRLDADMFVHLGLKDLELIQFGLVGHAQPSVAVSPPVQSGPEIGKLLEYLVVVLYGSPQVAGLVPQEGTVIDGHEVFGFHADHIVEIINGPVVIAHLYSEQTAVVVGEEIVRVQFKCLVIVAHGSPEVVDVQPDEGTVDIACHHLGFEVDDPSELFVCLLPVLPSQTDVCPCEP